MIRIDVLSLFPGLFGPFFETAFVGHARRQGLLSIAAHDLRDWATDRHRSVDDSPYGGGAGMVMTPEPLVTAIEALAGPKGADRRARVVYLSPQGAPLSQSRLERLAGEEALVFVCGRFEGVDERVIELAVDEEISIGDYVLSGGDLPAMVVIEGLVRLLPGVLGNPESIETESFRGGALLEGPHYTRPPIYRGLSVPEILRSGDHGAIAAWRSQQAEGRTIARRPDLVPALQSGREQGRNRDTKQGQKGQEGEQDQEHGREPGRKKRRAPEPAKESTREPGREPGRDDAP